MNANRRHAVAALAAAGLLWGTTVPLSKLALAWLSPGWLTFARFGIAAAILLVAARATLRAACSPAVLASGAIGYGGSVVVQNAGIGRTSVSHAALLVGAAPVLIAIIAALWQRTVARPVAWAGFALSLAGVALVAGSGGGGATAGGDGLVLASVLISGTFTVTQMRLLPGRDPVAVTAVQFLGAAIAVLPFAVLTGGMPATPAGPGVVIATAALAVAGTLLPFTLFAYGQSRVSAEVAGAFLNLEPLVGAVAGVVVFGNPAGLEQVTGGTAILAGIALSSVPLLAAGRRAAAGQPAAEPVPLPSAASPGPGHAGGPEVDPLELLARAGLRGAAQRQDDAGGGGDLDGRPLPARRDELVPARRAVRRAGQQRRRRLGTAEVRGRRGHQARPVGYGHHRAGRAPHRPLGARGTRDRPPSVPRRRRGVDAEPAARGASGE